jgi:hypothetical protein
MKKVSFVTNGLRFWASIMKNSTTKLLPYANSPAGTKREKETKEEHVAIKRCEQRACRSFSLDKKGPIEQT